MEQLATDALHTQHLIQGTSVVNNGHMASWLRQLPRLTVLSRGAAFLGVVSASLFFAGAARAQLGASLAQARTAAARQLALRELLDSVQMRHPLIEAARARVRAARGSRVTAGAFGNPTFGLDVENAPLPGGSTPAMDRETMTTLMLPLEPLYQRSSRVRRANADVRAAEADAAAEVQRTELDAARAYYSVALLQVGVDIARDLATWLDTVVAYNRVRVEEGATAEADLIRSQLERDRTAAEVSTQEADLARARAVLAAFLGDVPNVTTLMTIDVALDDAPLALPFAASVSPSSSPPTAAVSDTNIVERALVRRPQLRAAHERVSAATAGITSGRTMLFRQVGATLGTKQSAGTTSLVAGVSVPLPLFDQNGGEGARAIAERDASRFELAAEERSTRAEVLGAYAAARVLTDRATQLAARSDGSPTYLARADEARRIALGAYREGAVPLISVIDAARAWGEARLTYYRTIIAQHESVLTLVAAIGDDIASALPQSETGARR